jgi:Na+-transporting methylmalonyl-CoA/oxaloacetate decarboxylase gamma subunit
MIKGADYMDNWTFGIMVTVVGMGGTILTLWILSLFTVLLKRAFPLSKEQHADTKKAASKGGAS